MNNLKGVIKTQIPVIVVIGVIELLSRTNLYTPESYSFYALILLAVTAYSALKGGVKVGVISAAIAVIYNGHLLSNFITEISLSDRNFRRVVLIGVVLPIMAFIIGRLKDKSDKHLLNEQLARLKVEKAFEELKRSEQRKDEFVSMASHELKTPVSALKGYTQVLEKRLSSKGDSDTAVFLTKMNDQIDRLGRLVNDLLDVSRMQAGKLELKKERFSISQLIQEIVENNPNVVKNHKVILKSSRKNLSAFGDKGRIEQVLINLLSNAVKYSPQGKEIIIRASNGGGNVQVSVQDFGIGIERVHQKKIFSRFYRVEGLDEKNYPGIGVGLHIASEIIKRHGGEIGVESDKGKGSTFFFRLPTKEK